MFKKLLQLIKDLVSSTSVEEAKKTIVVNRKKK